MVNPLRELFEFLKRKGVFPQYENYNDYCKKTGTENAYIPLAKEKKTKIKTETLFDD